MKKNSEQRNNGHMKADYHFSAMKNRIRGKYYERYRKGANVVLLEPDGAKAFPTEDAGNQALRRILKAGRGCRAVGRTEKL